MPTTLRRQSTCVVPCGSDVEPPTRRAADCHTIVAGSRPCLVVNPQTEKIRKMLNNPSSGSAAVSDKTHGMKYLLAVRACMVIV